MSPPIQINDRAGKIHCHQQLSTLYPIVVKFNTPVQYETLDIAKLLKFTFCQDV